MLKSVAMMAFFISGLAQAETLSCQFQVIKKKDFIELNGTQENGRLVQLQIKKGKIDQLEEINGEYLYIGGFKFDHTDLFELTLMVLKNPKDTVKEALVVSPLRLYSVGPLTEGAYSPDVQEGSIGYQNLDYSPGQFTFSKLMRQELERKGLWGRHPYTSMSLNAGTTNFDELYTLLENSKNIQLEDVVMTSQLLGCTLNK